MSAQADARIAILAPMPSEMRPVARLLSLEPSGPGEGSLLRCEFGRAEIVAATTGIGTRAASPAAERVLDGGPVDHLVVVGIAGGVGPSVDVGDLVVPELVVDLATGRGYRPGSLGSTASRGTLVTSDEVPIDLAEVARLERQGVIAVDMETAAVAAVCEGRGCPWSAYRAISDRADDGSMDAAIFGLAGPDGEPDLGAVLRFVVTKPQRVPQLARLARGASLAAKAAASAAVRALGEVYGA